jgi:MFS family permease
MVVVLGYQLYDIARGSYGMSIKAAAFQLGVLGLVQFLPQILFAPIAGVIADRFDRRNVTALATMIDLVIALVLTAATAWGHSTCRSCSRWAPCTEPRAASSARPNPRSRPTSCPRP